MKTKRKKILITSVILILSIGLLCTGILGYLWVGPQFHPASTAYVYIDQDDTIDSIYNKVEKAGHLAQYRHYDRNIHTGRYAIRPGESTYHVMSRLFWGYQEPMNLVVGSVRHLNRLARNVGNQLMTRTPQPLPACWQTVPTSHPWDMISRPCLPCSSPILTKSTGICLPRNS